MFPRNAYSACAFFHFWPWLGDWGMQYRRYHLNCPVSPLKVEADLCQHFEPFRRQTAVDNPSPLQGSFTRREAHASFPHLMPRVRIAHLLVLLSPEGAGQCRASRLVEHVWDPSRQLEETIVQLLNVFWVWKYYLVQLSPGTRRTWCCRGWRCHSSTRRSWEGSIRAGVHCDLSI